MEKYSLYCTPEQTKKALELGAPINTWGFARELVIPTAEQMLGWLEEQKDILSIEISELEGYWQGYVATTNYKDSIFKNGYEYRKEATLAAIDAALEYLTNNYRHG